MQLTQPAAVRIYVAVERERERLTLDGSLSLLSELLNALRPAQRGGRDDAEPARTAAGSQCVEQSA